MTNRHETLQEALGDRVHWSRYVLLAVLLMIAWVLWSGYLKPLLLGRGLDIPMPVVLLGAIGGMIMSGIIGRSPAQGVTCSVETPGNMRSHHAVSGAIRSARIRASCS